MPIPSVSVVVLIVCLACIAGCALASPTGLNNIPTADVVPVDLLVLQQYTGFGPARVPEYVLGAKYGAARDWEIGIDSRVGPDTGGPATLQAKRRFEVRTEGLAVTLGAANISTPSRRSGKWAPYIVATQPMDGFRLHGGYMGQSGNEGFLAGIDADAGGGWTLRSDWVQVNDGDDSVFSLGFIRPIGERWLVEGWGAIPSQSGAEESYILKFDYVLDLSD